MHDELISQGVMLTPSSSFDRKRPHKSSSHEGTGIQTVPGAFGGKKRARAVWDTEGLDGEATSVLLLYYGRAHCITSEVPI